MESRGCNKQHTKAMLVVKVKSDFKLSLLVVFLLFVNCIESSPPYGRRAEERLRHLLSFFDGNSESHPPFGRNQHNHYHKERPLFEWSGGGSRNRENPQNLDFNQQFDETTRTTVVILPDSVRVITEDLDLDDAKNVNPSQPELQRNPTGPKLQGFDIPGEEKVPPAKNDASATNQLCPPGQGFYEKTGKCYDFAKKIPSTDPNAINPCGKFMDFYRNPANKSVGVCDCREPNRILGVRPLAYWKYTDRCYTVFDQGPCYDNEWFILTDDGVPACRRRTCPQNDIPKNETLQDPLEDRFGFWFRERGKCYQTRSTNYCNSGNLLVVFENNPKTGFKLSCAERNEIDKIETRFLTNTIKDLPCKPGYSRTANGQCSRAGSFE